jgi:hypothetical protein
MARRSIITVLGSLIITLLVTLNGLTVSAKPPCEGDAPVYCQGGLSNGARTFSIASADPAMAASPIDYRFLEMNTTTLPSVADQSTSVNDLWAIYRVSDSYYFVPVAGGMWVVIHVQADGLPMIEDYVSGPPPAIGIAVTPSRAEDNASAPYMEALTLPYGENRS